jgi:hypothetical protein
MISDVLSRAVVELREYLNGESFSGNYSGKVRERIKNLVQEMDSVRVQPDTAPRRELLFGFGGVRVYKLAQTDPTLTLFPADAKSIIPQSGIVDGTGTFFLIDVNHGEGSELVYANEATVAVSSKPTRFTESIVMCSIGTSFQSASR